MNDMKYEVEQAIYKVSQDRETYMVTFYVYGHEVATESVGRPLTHEELYAYLIEVAEVYGRRDENGD